MIFYMTYEDDQWDALKVLRDAEQKLSTQRPKPTIKSATQISPTVWQVETT